MKALKSLVMMGQIVCNLKRSIRSFSLDKVNFGNLGYEAGLQIINGRIDE